MKKEQQPKAAGPIPVSRPAAANTPKDQWTISNRVPVHEGEHVALAGHRVEILKILRSEPTYDVCKVRVLGPLPGTTSVLLWNGEPYDTEGRFTPQQAI